MSELTRREFVKAGAIGLATAGAVTSLATTEAQAKNSDNKPEHKGNRKRVRTMRSVIVRPQLTILGFKDNPSAPSNEGNGTMNTSEGVRAWIVVGAPYSEEEETRIHCELSYKPAGGSKVIFESGDIGYPFDGTPFYISGLMHNVSYTFEALAIYENAPTVPIARSFTITL